MGLLEKETWCWIIGGGTLVVDANRSGVGSADAIEISSCCSVALLMDTECHWWVHHQQKGLEHICEGWWRLKFSHWRKAWEWCHVDPRADVQKGE